MLTENHQEDINNDEFSLKVKFTDGAKFIINSTLDERPPGFWCFDHGVKYVSET